MALEVANISQLSLLSQVLRFSLQKDVSVGDSKPYVLTSDILKHRKELNIQDISDTRYFYLKAGGHNYENKIGN